MDLDALPSGLLELASAARVFVTMMADTCSDGGVQARAAYECSLRSKRERRVRWRMLRKRCCW